MLSSNNTQSSSNGHSEPTKTSLQTQKSDSLKCPRCDSTNTKFCYYNNYNKTQPRHYCKACKRYWTKGGTLRNVPVGGGRKQKRVKRPATAAATTATMVGNKGLIFNPKDSDFHQVSWDFNSSLKSQENLGFSTIDTNPSNPIMSTSFTQLLSGFKDDSILTTRSMISNSSNVSQPWIHDVEVPTASNFVEPNYWTWNEIDSLVQEDQNKPFDDPQMGN